MQIVFHIQATVAVLKWVSFICSAISKVCDTAVDALSMKLPEAK